MPPTIHLVRHAQGYHNLRVDSEKLHDSDLTQLGSQQCADLRVKFLHHAETTHLVASPMRRAIYTCIQAFDAHDNDSNGKGLYPIIAIDTLQEVSDAACDTGSAVSILASEFDAELVDLRKVRGDWVNKGEGSIFEPVLGKLAVRARDARRTLRELVGQGDGHIVVVSHGAFLQFITEEWYDLTPSYSMCLMTFIIIVSCLGDVTVRQTDQAPCAATSWKNCEYRSYQFIDPTNEDENATLRETDASWCRRYGATSRPTAEQLCKCQDTMEKELSPFFKVRD